MDENLKVKDLAKKVISNIGAVNSAAAAANKYPGSAASEAWWARKREELWDSEGELLELLQARRAGRQVVAQ